LLPDGLFSNDEVDVVARVNLGGGGDKGLDFFIAYTFHVHFSCFKFNFLLYFSNIASKYS
jgi:hypothetical protein